MKVSIDRKHKKYEVDADVEKIVEKVPGKRPDVFVGYDYDSKPVKSVNLMNKYVKEYYEADTDDEEYELIHFIKGDDTCALFGVDNPENGTQNLGLRWKDDGSEQYTVYFATNKLFTNYLLVNTSRNYLNDGVLMPGKTYYYRAFALANSHYYWGGIEEFQTLALRPVVSAPTTLSFFSATLPCHVDFTGVNVDDYSYGIESF